MKRKKPVAVPLHPSAAKIYRNDYQAGVRICSWMPLKKAHSQIVSLFVASINLWKKQILPITLFSIGNKFLKLLVSLSKSPRPETRVSCLYMKSHWSHVWLFHLQYWFNEHLRWRPHWVCPHTLFSVNFLWELSGQGWLNTCSCQISFCFDAQTWKDFCYYLFNLLEPFF